MFTLLEILFWPSVAFLSVGLLAEFVALEQKMKGFILVGVVSMGALQVCQLDVAYALLYDVWSKAVKHAFIVPVGIRHLIFGSLIVGIIRGGIVFFLLVGASYWIFAFDFTVPGIGPLCAFLCSVSEIALRWPLGHSSALCSSSAASTIQSPSCPDGQALWLNSFP